MTVYLVMFTNLFDCRSHTNEDNGEEVSHASVGGAALGVVHPRRYLRHSYATSTTCDRYKPHLYHIIVFSVHPTCVLFNTRFIKKRTFYYVKIPS